MPEAELTFTARALAKMSGISRDQLIHWDRDGLLQPARHRRGRVDHAAYTHSQALGVLALGDLKRRGVSQRRIRAAASALPAIGAREHAYLVFDGWLMHARRTDSEVVELATGFNGPCRVLEVKKLTEKLG